MDAEIIGVDGGVQTPEKVTLNGVPLMGEISIICYPMEEFFYKDEKVVYQVYELTRLSNSFLAPFVVVAGYKRSEPYIRGDGRKVMKVKIIEKNERSDLEDIIKLMRDDEYSVAFYEQKNGKS